MIRRRRLAVGAAALAVVLAGACARSPAPAPGAGLPDALVSWTALGDVSEFVGDELFIHINGGAEVYHEYGFERLRVREYGRGENRVVVEIYTVSGSAYGVYTYARSDRGSPVGIGGGGTLADYYLCAWSGSDLVVVTAQTEMDDPRAAVVEVAEGLAVPVVGDEPALMSRLPPKLVVPNTEAYLRGPLALRSVAGEAGSLLVGFDEAAAARVRVPEGRDALLVVARWSDPESAVVAIDRSARAASELTRIQVESTAADRLRFDHGMDEVIELTRSDEEVWLVVGPEGAVGFDEVIAGHREEERHGSS